MVLGEPRRTILAFQAYRERVDAGPQRRHPALSFPLSGLQLGDASVGQPHRRHRPLVMLVETDLALIQLTDAALHGFELRPGLLHASGALFDALGQPRDAVVDRFDARPHRLDLTGQPGQAFPAVGLGSDGRQVCTVGLGSLALTLGQFRAGLVQPGPRRGELGEQLLLGDRHLLGLGLQGVGIGVTGRHGLDIEVLRAFAGDAHRGAHPFGQGRQPKPGLLHALGPHRQLF